MTLITLLWAIAFGICPQRPSHSLFLGGEQMPIEARMAGMFAGFLITVGYFMATGRGRAWQMPRRWMAVTLISFVGLLGADGVNALFYDLRLPYLYSPNLMFRLGTGLLTGIAIASFVWPVFNISVWQSGLPASPLASARDLIVVIALQAVYFAAAFSGQGVLFYPVSLLAVLGVPVLIATLGSVIAVIVLRRENRAKRWVDLLSVAVVGLMLAGLVLSGASLIRYVLFGTAPLG